ncbi:MAG: hypothetical protein KIT09_35375 [Bryobacteraceae bacterium]|nr:hypothetical protein [Bryobacteraceae bacterium]
MRILPRLLAIAIQPLTLGAAAGPFQDQEIKVMREVMDAIYRTDYVRSERLSRQLMADAPDDPIGYVFLARTIWQQELSRTQALALNRFAAPDFFVEKQMRKYKLQPDPKAEVEFDRISQQAIAKARERLKTAPDDLRTWFLLGLAHQNVATFNASLEGSWKKAFFAGESTRRAHERVHVRYPDFADALVSLGVYEYVAGSVNWFYRLWGALLGIHGDQQRGLANLEKAARESAFLGGDAQSMLVLLHARERKYQLAFDVLAELRREYPENYFVPMDQGTLALKMNQTGVAVAIYRELLDRVEKQPGSGSGFEPAAILNQLGIAHRMGGELSASRETLERALSSPASSERARAVAHLELGKTLDLDGRREEAVAHYRQVKAAMDVVGSLEEAERLLERPYRER